MRRTALLLILLACLWPTTLSTAPFPPNPLAPLFRFLFRSGGTKVATASAERYVIKSVISSGELALNDAAKAGLVSTARQGDQLIIKNLTDDYLSIGVKPEHADDLLAELLKGEGYPTVSSFQSAHRLKPTGTLDDATVKILEPWITAVNRRKLAGIPNLDNPYQSILNLTLRSDPAEVAAVTKLKGEMLNPTQIEELQNVLAFNGYSKEAVSGTWTATTEKAANGLLINKGLKVEESALSNAVSDEAKEILVGLRSIGFQANDLKTGIMKFQSFRGLPETGRLSGATVGALKKEMSYGLEVKHLAASTKTPYQYLVDCKRLTGKKSPIASFQKIDDSFYALVENATHAKPKTELWRVKAGKVERVGDDAQYQEVISSSKRQIEARVNDPMIISGLPDKTGGTAHLVSQRKTLTKLESDIDVWHDFKELDELFARKAGSENVIVNRSFYDRAIRKIDDEAYTLTNLKFNNEDLYHLLNQRYGKNYNFFLDDELDVAVKNVNSLPAITKATDVKIMFSEYGKIDNDGIINSLLDNHGEHKFLFERKLVPVPNSNVILVTGHKSDDLRSFLVNHGKLNNLKDKAIAVFSCYDASDANFYSDLIRKYGAKEIVYFPYELKSSAVNVTLDELVKSIVRDPAPGAKGEFLHDMIRKAVENAIKNPANKLNQMELEKLLYSIKQVSQLSTPSQILEQFS